VVLADDQRGEDGACASVGDCEVQGAVASGELELLWVLWVYLREPVKYTQVLGGPDDCR
jgi:hypothetical protein